MSQPQGWRERGGGHADIPRANPSHSTHTGKDYTLFSKIEGTVRFHTRNNRKFISVDPVPEA